MPVSLEQETIALNAMQTDYAHLELLVVLPVASVPIVTRAALARIFYYDVIIPYFEVPSL